MTNDEAKVFTNHEAPARVARGVALLDEAAAAGKVPRFWRTFVDVTELDHNSVDKCVLGQVFGLFSEGRKALGLGIEDAADYGFDFHSGTMEEEFALYDAWLEVLGNGSAV